MPDKLNRRDLLLAGATGLTATGLMAAAPRDPGHYLDPQSRAEAADRSALRRARVEPTVRP